VTPSAQTSRQGRRGAATRAAGCAVELPGIARRWGIEAGVLRRHRLAEKDCSRLTPAAHAGGILAGDALLPQARAGGRRPVEDVEDILDTQRNAVERPAIVSLFQLARQSLRVCSCAFLTDEHPGPHPAFQLVDACQALFEDLNRGTAAQANVLGRGVESLHQRYEVRGQKSVVRSQYTSPIAVSDPVAC